MYAGASTTTTLEEIEKACTRLKQCGACGKMYTDVDNLTLPCCTHPGEPLGDFAEPDLRVWSCCAETTRYGDRSYPCTRSAHTTAESWSADAAMLPTVVVLKGAVVDAEQFESANARVDAVVVKSVRDLLRAEQRIGRVVRSLPCYEAVAGYVTDRALRDDDDCRYYYSPDAARGRGTETATAAPQEANRSMTVILARASSAPVAVQSASQRLAELRRACRLHILRDIARDSPNPFTRATARVIVGDPDAFVC